MNAADLAGQCTARYNGHERCARPAGHTGMHRTDLGDLRWGGRYSRAELTGRPMPEREARRDLAARLRRPPGERCRICCRDGQELSGSICADRASCEAVMPPLFDAAPRTAGRPGLEP